MDREINAMQSEAEDCRVFNLTGRRTKLKGERVGTRKNNYPLIII
jgi:hypothetical protein